MATCQAKDPKRIPQVRYAVTAGYGARRSVPHQAPARRVHGACPSPPPQFSSSDGIWHRQIEPRLPWCTTARHGISCDKRRPCQSPRSNRTRCKARATANCIYKYQYGHLCRKVVADVGKNLSALARRSGQLRPYVRPVTRHSPLAIMGVRLRARHRSVRRTRGTQPLTVLPELSN
jgi:hypothetical protein